MKIVIPLFLSHYYFSHYFHKFRATAFELFWQLVVNIQRKCNLIIVHCNQETSVVSPHLTMSSGSNSHPQQKQHSRPLPLTGRSAYSGAARISVSVASPTSYPASPSVGICCNLKSQNFFSFM
jgi:hypothetical protein